MNYDVVFWDGFHQTVGPPGLTVLNYSGGQQSEAIAHMVLRGEIEKPESFVMLNADPGMENSRTYLHVAAMREKAEASGIRCVTVEGPNLYLDLLGSRGKSRVDNPAYYTRNPNGSRGMLRQKCTKHYKIAPMDREIRRTMRRIGLPLTEGIVEKWIGFAADEIETRLKLPKQKYVRFRYPLVELGMTKADVLQWFLDNGIPAPPRSVCNACMAHSPADLKSMHDTRPEDWEQAVAVDDAVRDWTSSGVENPVYVSDSLLPLRDLARLGFVEVGQESVRGSCDSGYCFT